MKPLVSIVVPCYNKKEHIGNMLNSVYKQAWDNVELVLINDGSTDGTRDVITDWIPKLNQRGYIVKLLDQENKGVTGAVKTGLTHVTGEYVCCVDSDDEIETEYISTLAGFLDKHPECKWVACDMLIRYKEDESRDIPASKLMQENHDSGAKHLIENFIGMRICTSVGQYMVRKYFMDECNIVENFATEIGSQEPSYVIPLIVYGFPPKYIPKPLYVNNRFAAGFSERRELYPLYADNTRTVVSRLNITKNERVKLFALVDHISIKFLFLTGLYDDHFNDEERHELALKATGWIDNHFSPAPCLPIGIIDKMGWLAFWEAVDARIRGELIQSPFSVPANSQVIAYGVLGYFGGMLVDKLMDTPLRPSLLWDRAAKSGSAMSGLPVVQPDFRAVDKNSIVLLTMSDPRFVDEAKELLADKGPSNVLGHWDIVHFLAHYYLADKLNKCTFQPSA